MLKKTLIVIGLFSAMQTVSAQDPKHLNCYKDVNVTVQGIDIKIEDAVSRADFNKFKIKLINTTTDYMLFIPKESIINLEGQEYAPKDRKMALGPLDKGSRVIDIKGESAKYHVNAFTYQINGLYQIPANGPSLEAPNFKLPASINEFTVGSFKVNMIKIKKETDVTVVKFQVTYLGSGYGLVDPNKLGVKIPNGQEYANAKTKQDAIILAKGESDTFIAQFEVPGKVADMQFANMEILWRDTFKEASLKKIEVPKIDLVLDEGKTAAKNK